MKKISWILALLVALTFAFIGCDDSNYQDDPPIPKGTVVFSLADWIDEYELEAGVLDLGSDSDPKLPPVIIAGGPTVTLNADGALVFTNRTEDYYAIDIERPFFSKTAEGGSYTVTVKLKVDKAVQVKLAGSSSPWASVVSKTVAVADVDKEVTLTEAELTPAKVKAGNLRIQTGGDTNDSKTAILTITSIEIKAN